MKVWDCPGLAHSVRISALKSGLTLLASGDVTVRAIAVFGDLEGHCKETTNSLRLNWPVTSKDSVRASMKLKDAESKDWEGLVSQGHGAIDFRDDPHGNCWLYDPSVFSPNRFIHTLNSGPTRLVSTLS